jgi:phosphate-selective porin OprO/OprP
VTNRIFPSAIAIAVAAGWSLPAAAQGADSAAIQQELAAMRAQMAQMASRIDTLEGQLADARAKADAATAVAQTAQASAQSAAQASAQAATQAAATVTAKPDTQIAWDGAPKLTGKGGWSFKPRGRLQVDVAGVDARKGMTAANQRELGFQTEFRRAYIGFDGTMPGGFGYRVEADLANSAVELTDVYLTYKANPDITLTVGQHKPFWGLEEMTSDLYTSFRERAAAHGAFGFERRVGASASYLGKTLLVQGGVFTDNAADLNSDANNSYSFDGRVVFMPKLGKGQLHVGGSFHNRDFNDAQSTTRYRARPFTHTTDLRLVDTAAIAATGETSYGLELAYINGRFHATGESHWITPRRRNAADPTFNGGYAEVGMLLTDDTVAYKGGVYDRIRPKHPLGGGGMGALQVNARYDWLDLSDKSIVGGRQQAAGLALQWIATDYVRFILDYGHLWFNDAAITAGGKRDYQADTMGMRAQFDF